jgi:putative Mn2+ efflux pump MntP
MWLAEIMLLALALAVDAFTVGAAVGLRHGDRPQIFRLSWHFGVFQALMPLIGAQVGRVSARLIGGWDRWVAFGLLAFIGARMVWGSFKPEGERVRGDLTRGLSLVGLSIAVSIDALAAGFSLGVGEASIALSVVIIGVVAAVLTAVGMLIGGRLRGWVGKRCELAAGVVLIGLGIKVVII